VGDAEFQAKCLGKMESVTRQGRTVLFVSHNMGAVTRLCPNAICLGHGEVIDRGPAVDVVHRYLGAGGASDAEKSWPDIQTAPGGDVVSLVKVRVKNENELTANSYSIGEKIGLEMTFIVKKDDYRLNPHFHLFNHAGDHMFVTMDIDPQWLHKPRPVGRYVSTAWVPGNLLNEGTLQVSAALGTVHPRANQFFVSDAVAFQVVDDLESGGARGDWGGKIDGIIRPRLQWETRFEKD
jgi:lipopolysaccharide transport system ATP-binding protein